MPEHSLEQRVTMKGWCKASLTSSHPIWLSDQRLQQGAEPRRIKLNLRPSLVVLGGNKECERERLGDGQERERGPQNSKNELWISKRIV